MKVLVIYMAGLTLFCYVLGTLVSLPEVPVSSNSFVSKLSGESAFALMSLLGANVMPHYFYVHSSIVQVLSCILLAIEPYLVFICFSVNLEYMMHFHSLDS